MSCEPWQCAEVAATKKAKIATKPEIVVALIRKSEYPILVVGSYASERTLKGKLLIEYLIDFARAAKVPVVATAHMVGEFLKRGYKPAKSISLMDIGNRLVDPEWKGIHNKGHPDLVLLVGIPYYMESLVLSGLKHFTPDLRTLAIDNLYHPHAHWSFPNLTSTDWANNLEGLTSNFKKKLK